MSGPEVEWDALVPGRRYRVELGDCCVNGWFEAVFDRIVMDDGEPDKAVFDVAEVEPGWSFGGAISFHEVPNPQLETVERLLSMLTDAQTEAEMQAAEVERLRQEVETWKGWASTQHGE